MVSVIVTTYNREKLLSETVSAILHQTYRDIELIVIDNYSNYDVAKLINSFNDSRIRLMQNRNNGVIAANRNIGIKDAKGEYIAFCDDDDVWTDDKLESQLTHMAKHKANFCSCDCLRIDADGTPLQKFAFLRDQLLIRMTPKKNIRNLMISNFIITSSVIVKKDLLNGHAFDEDPLLVAVEDYHLWMELLSGPDCRYIFFPKKCVKYRVQLSSTIDRKNRLLNGIRREYALVKYLRKHPDVGLLRIFRVINTLKLLKSFVVG